MNRLSIVGDWYMHADSLGKYVLYSDVKSLQAERDRLNASLAEAKAERDRLREALYEIESVCSGQTRGIVVHIDRIASAALSKALGE